MKALLVVALALASAPSFAATDCTAAAIQAGKAAIGAPANLNDQVLPNASGAYVIRYQAASLESDDNNSGTADVTIYLNPNTCEIQSTMVVPYSDRG